MIEGREAWTDAYALLELHGDCAWWVAAQHADERLAAGELDAYRHLLRILRCLDALDAQASDTMVH